MIRRFATFPDFFPEAEEMRRQFDRHFEAPYEQSETSHGIWNYWYVPEQYNYLRADPARIFDGVLDRFMAHLRAWSRKTLGLSAVSAPSMHLYLNGCGQGLHSDFHNGVWGWVLSLTRWDDRSFQGGETLMFRDGVPNYKRHHVGGNELYELTPARFNQVLVFDDRIVHAVRTLQGTMDPRQGRLVLNGHFYGGAPVVDGPLDADEVHRRVWDALPELRKRLSASPDLQGMISLRLQVSEGGVPGSPELLFNNIVSSRQNAQSIELATNMIRDHLLQLRFPAAETTSSIAIPILVPVPTLEPIRVETVHALGIERARVEVARVVSYLRFHAGLDGAWAGDVFRTICPGPGFIEVTERVLRAEIDVAMMHPLQTKALQLRLEKIFQEPAPPTSPAIADR